MQCVSVFAALALALGAGKTMACENAGCAIGEKFASTECNSVGCVRPTNGLDNLAKIAERSLSVMRAPDSAKAPGLCNAVTCSSEPPMTRLPEHCGRASCAMPDEGPAVTNAIGVPTVRASILVTDVFAALTERSMRVPSAIAWGQWTERWGFGGLYKPAATD